MAVRGVLAQADVGHDEQVAALGADRAHRLLNDAVLGVTLRPAFVLGGFIVGGLGKLGINQVPSFMFVMPVLIFAWYYFMGWLFDRWIRKRSQAGRLSP